MCMAEIKHSAQEVKVVIHHELAEIHVGPHGVVRSLWRRELCRVRDLHSMTTARIAVFDACSSFFN